MVPPAMVKAKPPSPPLAVRFHATSQAQATRSGVKRDPADAKFLDPKMARARKLQGQYLGALRSLSAEDTARGDDASDADPFISTSEPATAFVLGPDDKVALKPVKVSRTVAAFCGGNVAAISYDIEYRVYQQLMTPNGSKAAMATNPALRDPSTGAALATTTASMVPLAAISSVGERAAATSINHQDATLATTISFNLAEGFTLSQAQEAVKQAEADIAMPNNVRGSFEGQAKGLSPLHVPHIKR